MPDSNDPPDGQQSPEDKINAQINAAVTGHLKRAMAKQAEDFKTLIAEQLKSFKPAPPPPDESESKEKPSKADPALAAMRQQMEAMQASLAEANTKRERAEAKQREDKAFNELKDALKSKIRPEMVDMVAKNFFYADKRVEFDEDGTALFRHRRQQPGLADEDVLMPLSEGVSAFLGSKDAAPFLPAPVPGGGNQQPNRGARMPSPSNQSGVTGANGLPKYDKPATTSEEKIRRALEAENIIKKSQGL